MTRRGRSRSKALLWVAALVGLAVTARLGLWQLARADQKLALQAQIQQRGALPPLAVADLPHQPQAAAALHFRAVRLTGRWLDRHTVYLDNRQMNGRPGFFVVTPLLLADGSAVAVQRGWLPRDFVDRSRLAPVATPSGEVQVVGRLAPPPSKLLALGAADSGPIRQNLDLDQWSRDLQLHLRPLSVQQTGVAPRAAAAPEPADGLLRQWPAPAVDVGKHHGYAVQWFGLCALIAGLAVWFLILHPRLPKRPDPPRPHG